ncbi:MAG: hypothetical protein KGI25_05275 [Thaumarchaeota archaeon]|nr:hypothetical protein [Nitrososphaerota archaeon]
MSDDIVSLKNAISIYEKELQRETEFLKKTRQPENKINDPEISAAIVGPSASRLFDLYERLLDSYRKYVTELEKNQRL